MISSRLRLHNLGTGPMVDNTFKRYSARWSLHPNAALQSIFNCRRTISVWATRVTHNLSLSDTLEIKLHSHLQYNGDCQSCRAASCSTVLLYSTHSVHSTMVTCARYVTTFTVLNLPDSPTLAIITKVIFSLARHKVKRPQWMVVLYITEYF